MYGIFPSQEVKLGKETISPVKMMKTFFPIHPVEGKEGSEQDF
jgi:hypothetical protein